MRSRVPTGRLILVMALVGLLTTGVIPIVSAFQHRPVGQSYDSSRAMQASSVSATLTWVDFGLDLVGSLDNPNSDGQRDGHFSLALEVDAPTSVTGIALFRSDRHGNPMFPGAWDTTPGGPWVLGVYRDGVRLNPQDVDILDPVDELVTYDLYANDSGNFTGGQYFTASLVFTDGVEVSATALVSLDREPAPNSSETLSLDWVDFDDDRVGSWSDPGPDGRGDGHFLVSLDAGSSRTISVITLYTSDRRGNPLQGQWWNTAPDQTWILGVYREGVRLNPSDTELNDAVGGRVSYDVYANDSGYFTGDGSFAVTVQSSDGTVYKTVTTMESATAEVVVESRIVAPGDTVRAPVMLNDVNGIGSMDLVLTYDPGVISVEGVHRGSVTSQALVAANYGEEGVVRIGLAAPVAIPGNGSLMYVTFRALGDDGARSSVELAEIAARDVSGRPVDLNHRNGIVTVTVDKPKNDLNGDGKVTEVDALIVAKLVEAGKSFGQTVDDIREIMKAAVTGGTGTTPKSGPTPQPTDVGSQQPDSTPKPALAMLSDDAIESELVALIDRFIDGMENEEVDMAMAPFKQGVIVDGIDHYNFLISDVLDTFERYERIRIDVHDVSFRRWGDQMLSMLHYTFSGLASASGQEDTAELKFMWTWEQAANGWLVVDSRSMPPEYYWE